MNSITRYIHQRESLLHRELWAAIHEALKERIDRDHLTKVTPDHITFHETVFPDGYFKFKDEIIVTIEEGMVHKEPLPVHGCATQYEAHSRELAIEMMVERTKAMSQFLTDPGLLTPPRTGPSTSNWNVPYFSDALAHDLPLKPNP